MGRLESVPGLIRRIITEELWRERRVETGEIVRLNSFRELITAKSFRGWETDPAKIEAIIRDDAEVLALWREAMKEQGKRNDLGNNVPQVKEEEHPNREPRGNARAYTVSRLQSQRPDLFQRVKSGDLSANAAAIEAGWRTKPTPLDALRKAWAKASDTERELVAGQARNITGTACPHCGGRGR